MEEKKSKKKTIWLAIALIITFIALAAGVTYAYFVIEISGTSEDTTLNIGTAEISVEYVHGADLTPSGKILPGWSDKCYFSVTEVNTSNQDVSYLIQVYASEYDFDSESGYLQASLRESSTSGSFTGSTSTPVNINSGATTVETVVLSAGTNTQTKYYELTISYPNNVSSVQSQGRNFAGYVKLVAGTASIYQS